MTAPRVRRGQPGYRQLGVFVPAALKDRLVAAAETEDRPQREILEEALGDYFVKKAAAARAALPEPAPT